MRATGRTRNLLVLPVFGSNPALIRLTHVCRLHLRSRIGADGGKNFGPDISILRSKNTTSETPQRNSDAKVSKDSWYTHFVKGPTNSPKSHVIGLCFNYHLHESPGHGHHHYNGYYMEMDTRDGKWRNVLGETLNMPLTKEDADRQALVYNSGSNLMDVDTCILDDKGVPHITFLHDLEFPRYFKWLSGHRKWLGPIVIGESPTDKSKGTFVLTGHDQDHVRMLKATDDGEVAYWDTIDEGVTWTKSGVVLEVPRTRGMLISSALRNAHHDARVLVAANAGSGWYGARAQDRAPYKQIFLVGDNGAVPRIAKEAEGLWRDVYNYTRHRDMDRFKGLTGKSHADAEAGKSDGYTSGSGKPVTGEEACENHGHDSAACIRVGCCKYELGDCHSAVGKQLCQRASGVLRNGQRDNDPAAVRTEHAEILPSTSWRLHDRECPDGRRNAVESECFDAVQEAAQQSRVEMRGFKSVDDAWLPYGCSYSQVSKGAIFNSNPNGEHDEGYQPVCGESSPRDSTQRVDSAEDRPNTASWRFHYGECPDDQRNAAEGECLDAVQAAAQQSRAEMRRFIKRVYEAGLPYGCSYSLVSKGAIFNSNPAGASGEWYQRVCTSDSSPRKQKFTVQHDATMCSPDTISRSSTSPTRARDRAMACAAAP